MAHLWRITATVEFDINYEPQTITRSDACALVWNVTDILPGEYVDLLANLDLKRPTYAAAASAMRKYLPDKIGRGSFRTGHPGGIFPPMRWPC